MGGRINGRIYETTKFPIYKDGKPIAGRIHADITDKTAETSCRRASASLIRREILP